MKYFIFILILVAIIIGWLNINPYPTANEKFNELVVIQEEI